jgi:hypothetical protein
MTRSLRVWPLAGLVAVAVAAAATAVVTVVLDHHPPGGLIQTLLAIFTAAGGLAAWLWQRLRWEAPEPGLALASAADALANAALQQWDQAAVERGLRYPAPIPVRWRRSRRPVVGPLEAALGTPYTRTGFAALPGIPAVTAAALESGGLADLAGIYGGLRSGRIIVVGGPGTGKSAAAILTVVEALEHRRDVSDTERGQVPVPVLLTVHGWDPRWQRVAKTLTGVWYTFPERRPRWTTTPRPGIQGAMRLVTRFSPTLFHCLTIRGIGMPPPSSQPSKTASHPASASGMPVGRRRSAGATTVLQLRWTRHIVISIGPDERWATWRPGTGPEG